MPRITILHVINIQNDMCLNPRLIRNKRFLPNKSNDFDPPECDDERKRWVPIGCQLCIECRKKKANSWRVRIMEEIKNNRGGVFVTLSLSDESIDKLQIDNNMDANDVATQAVRYFLERVRAAYGVSIKHIFFTELGQHSTQRIHLHGIVWYRHLFNDKEFTKLWKYGNIYFGSFCNERTGNYIVKYITKSDPLHKEFYSKCLCSKGIGLGYMDSSASKRNSFSDKDTKDYYRLNNGFKVQLPDYYRHKIYTDEERDILWTNKLDEECRFVMGHKIDVSTPEGMDNYESARKYHSNIDMRNGNLQLKYQFNKDRKEYKARCREIAYLTAERKRLNDDFG